MTGKLLCAPGDPEWLELRRAGITATDIVTIAGLVTWDSPWALYHRKRGDLPEVEQSDRMRLGLWLEGAVARHWQQSKHGRGNLMGPGLYRNKARPWQLATPDHVVSLADVPSRPGSVLDCKSTSQRDGWGDDGTADVPPRVRAQVLWQMDVLDVPVGHVAVVFLPSGEFRSYTIHWDEQAESDLITLRGLGHHFLQRMIGLADPPDIDDLAVTTEALKLVYPGGRAEPAQLTQDLVDRYDMACAMAAVAAAVKRHAVNDIRAAMGDADRAELDGRVVFRREFSKVAGYTVAPYERDTIKRVKDD